jgi:hypothetical protein
VSQPRFKATKGRLLWIKIRTVDKRHLIKNPGSISKAAEEKALLVLQEIFSP